MRGWLVRLRALLWRRHADAELEEELREHLARDTERRIALGLSPREAADAARRAFGNPTSHAEAARAAWGWSWLEQAVQDLRHGLRALRRNPVFALVCVLSLGLGLGVNTTVFTLVHGILMAPLAVSSPSGLFSLARVGLGGSDAGFSPAQFAALQQARDMALTSSRSIDNVSVAVGEDEDYTNVEIVGPAYYATLGLAPRFGRPISDDDQAGGARVAVLGERYALRWFTTPAAAVGRTIRIEGEPFEIVGVTAATWRGIDYPGSYTLAIPERASAAIAPPGGRSPLYVFGRLAGGATRSRAQDDLNGLLARCCASAAREHLALQDMSHGIGGGKDDARSSLGPVLVALMAAVLVVLLIAAANVATLQLLRGVAREREIAIRLSLGSSRGRIVRQLLTESALLGALGVAVALVLARWASNLLAGLMPDLGNTYPEMIRHQPMGAIVVFALLAGAGSTLVFGLAPALRATRPGTLALHSGVHAPGGGSRQLLGRGLVTIQVALALVLVSGAALLLASLRNLTTRDIGVVVSRLSATAVETRGTRYDSAGIGPESERILGAATAVPGVRAAGLTTVAALFGGRNAQVQVAAADGASARRTAMMAGITPGYFEAMGIAVLAGRPFGGAEHAGSERVAVLSHSLARQVFGNRTAIGRQVRLDEDSAGPLLVIGEVSDVDVTGPRAGPTPTVYRPLVQLGRWPYAMLAWRSRSDDPAVTPAVLAAVKAAVPGIRIRFSATARDRLAAWLLREILVASLTAVFGALALGLCAIGLYGVIAFGVARRTGEIGVRMALGARRHDVVSLVVRQAAALTVTGLILGAPLALLATRATQSLLYGLTATDPGMLVLAVGTLLAVATLAAAVPAVRAARIDPLVALRSE